MNNTARSFTIVTGFSIATRALSFIFKIWISRALGAETVGLYQIAMSVMMMLFTLTSGAPTVLSRKVAEATGDIKRQNSLATASLILGFAVSTSLFGIFFGLRSKLGFLFSDDRCLPIFLIMLPTLVTSTLYASFRSWFWGRKKFLAFSSTELLDEIVKILLSAVFAGGVVATITPAQGIALAMTLSDAVCVLALAVIYFLSGGRLAKPHGFKELTISTVPLSATRIITSLTTSFTALIIPQLLTKYGMSVAEATAEYGRASGMALPLIMAPVMFISSLSVVLIPDVAQLKAVGELDGVRKKLSGALSFGMIVAAAFFVLYLPLGKHIGAMLFKDAKAGEFVSYCSPLLFPIAIAQVTTPMLNSLGKEKITFISSLVGAILTVPCIFFLPKFVGVYAMAIGSGTCFVFISAMNLIALKKYIGSFGSPAKFLKILAFAIPLAAIGYFSDRLLSRVAGELTCVLIIGVFLVFFIFVCINAFEIADIAGYIKLLAPRSKSKKRV